MQLTHGFGWLLAAVIFAGWALSWWARLRWFQWYAPGGGFVVSVLFIAYGILDYGKPIDQSQLHCSHVVECLDQHPAGFMSNGILGLTCSLALVLVTAVADFVVDHRTRASTE